MFSLTLRLSENFVPKKVVGFLRLFLMFFLIYHLYHFHLWLSSEQLLYKLGTIFDPQPLPSVPSPSEVMISLDAFKI